MKVKPVFEIHSSKEEDRKKKIIEQMPEKFKRIDSRIKNIVLEKFIRQQSKRLYKQLQTNAQRNFFFTLFHNFLRSSNLQERVCFPRLQEQQDNILKTPRYKTAPIGIYGFAGNSWINSLIQFIIFLPNLRASFDFAPKKLAAFTKFIDIYESERAQEKAVTAANSLLLVRTLEELPLEIFSLTVVNFCEILNRLFKVIYPDIEYLESSNNSWEEGIELLAFHPKRMLCYDCQKEKNFEEFVFEGLQKSKESPMEFILFSGFSEKHLPFDLKKRPKKSFSYNKVFYEVDAFIEAREESRNHYHYLAYVKAENVWHQCDDERISQINSNVIKIPMRNGIVFHYKKIFFLNKIIH